MFSRKSSRSNDSNRSRSPVIVSLVSLGFGSRVVVVVFCVLSMKMSDVTESPFVSLSLCIARLEHECAPRVELRV